MPKLETPSHLVLALTVACIASGCAPPGAARAPAEAPHDAAGRSAQVAKDCTAKLQDFEKKTIPDAEFTGSSTQLENYDADAKNLDECIAHSPSDQQAAMTARKTAAQQREIQRFASGALRAKSSNKALMALSQLVERSESKAKLPADSLTMVHQAAEARVAARADELKATGSYAKSGPQCLLSKTKLGKPEESANLSYRFDASSSVVYVRCLANVDLSKLARSQGSLQLTVSAAGNSVVIPLGAPKRLPADSRYIDAEVTLPAPTKAAMDIYIGRATLEYRYADGDVVDDRTVKTHWQSESLASSGFFVWERTP